MCIKIFPHLHSLHQGVEEDMFPAQHKDFVNMDMKIRLKISEDNINGKSDVYEACDVNSKADEYLVSNTSMNAQSFEAEDDGGQMVI